MFEWNHVDGKSAAISEYGIEYRSVYFFDTMRGAETRDDLEKRLMRMFEDHLRADMGNCQTVVWRKRPETLWEYDRCKVTARYHTWQHEVDPAVREAPMDERLN